MVAGAILYAAGLVGAALVGNAIGLHLTFGFMVGVAQAATTFVVVLGAVGRVVPPERRSLAFGIVTAGGSLGQFLVVLIRGEVAGRGRLSLRFDRPRRSRRALRGARHRRRRASRRRPPTKGRASR